MNNTKILYVEDEASLAMIVKESLETRGFQVHLITDGGKAVQAFERLQPDICVLDIMLPNTNGYEIGKAIRQLDKQVPILFLTAKVQTKDVLTGFESGGNDYIKKPFSMEELIVRIQNLCALSGNARESAKTSIEFGQSIFYPKKQELHLGGEPLKLSHRETRLLEILSKNCNETSFRKQILLDLWGDDSFFNSRNLDVYINKLRKYLRSEPSVEIITLKGVGYLFKVDD
ncbi:MAG: response regulator transcription factor [Bacteroidia bacterium]|nr:response regulator transcription factor [Bacteroidia bacterium]